MPPESRISDLPKSGHLGRRQNLIRTSVHLPLLVLVLGFTFALVELFGTGLDIRLVVVIIISGGLVYQHFPRTDIRSACRIKDR